MRSRTRPLTLAPLSFLLALTSGSVLVGTSRAQSTERVSLANPAEELNGNSSYASVSENGRWIAFDTRATNLVPGADSSYDVYLRDRESGTTTLVSAAAGTTDVEANGTSQFPRISRNGRYVTFFSGSTNLTALTSNVSRIVRKDLVTGEVADVSLRQNGTVAWTNADFGVSSSGRFVAYSSFVADILPGDTNGKADVFVHDIQTGSIERASLGPDGTQPNADCTHPSITRDGRWVVFRSSATNLLPGVGGTQIYAKDLETGVLQLVSATLSGQPAGSPSSSPVIASLGRYVAFESASWDMYAWSAPPSVRMIYVRDLVEGVTWPASASAGQPADNYSHRPSISADGRFTAFECSFGNAHDQVFVHDRLSGSLTAVSSSTAGAAANGWATRAALSEDGRFVAYDSFATNLVAGDTNGFSDVFLTDRSAGDAFDFGVGKVDSIGCQPTISSNGTPSASAGSGFNIDCTNAQNFKGGLVFYGVNGAATASFLGGVLYVAPPLKRGPLLFSGGNAGPPDCSGAYSYDFNVRIASGVDPFLVTGATVCAQYWSRDPGDAAGSALSNGLTFAIQP